MKARREKVKRPKSIKVVFSREYVVRYGYEEPNPIGIISLELGNTLPIPDYSIKILKPKKRRKKK